MKITTPEGKTILGVIGAVAGVTGTAYMITDLTKEKQKEVIPAPVLNVNEGGLTKEEAEALREKAKNAEAAAENLKGELADADNKAKALESAIQGLTEENERVNQELTKTLEEKEETEELYVGASGDNIKLRESYSKQTLDYAKVVKENNTLRNQLNKFERFNPLVPRVGCWVAKQESSDDLYALNCPGEYPRNNGEMVKANIVTFATKEDQPELYEEFKALYEIHKGKALEA